MYIEQFIRKLETDLYHKQEQQKRFVEDIKAHTDSLTEIEHEINEIKITIEKIQRIK